MGQSTWVNNDRQPANVIASRRTSCRLVAFLVFIVCLHFSMVDHDCFVVEQPKTRTQHDSVN